MVYHAPGVEPAGALMEALRRPDKRSVCCSGVWGALAHLCTRSGPLAPMPGESTVLILVEPLKTAPVLELINAVERYAPDAAVWIFDSEHAPTLRVMTPEDVSIWRVMSKPRESERRVETMPPAMVTPARLAPSVTITGPGAVAAALTDDASAVVTTRRLGPAPQLRLAGEGTLRPRPSEDGAIPSPEPDVKPTGGTAAKPAASEAAAPLLTDEELAMLLDDPAKTP